MELMEALYTRRSVRKYTDQKVEKELIEELLQAPINAPSAMNTQPWSFVIIQDKELLNNYSARSKAHFLNLINAKPELNRYKEMLSNPDFDIFYKASTLILICANPEAIHAYGDCCMAAQNLMLAAHAQGLGSCWIGFSREFLNTAEAKEELGIPEDYIVVAPLVIGYPETNLTLVPKNEPVILAWK